MLSILYDFFSDSDSWEKYIIHIVVPVVTIVGTYLISSYQFRKEERIKKENLEKENIREKDTIVNSIKLAVIQSSNLVKTFPDLLDSVSFNKLDVYSIAIFTNEPLMIINEISKRRYDELFDIFKFEKISDVENYYKFLTGRYWLLKMYEELNSWALNYKNERNRLVINFEIIFIKYLNFLNSEIQKSDNKVLSQLFTSFISEHDEYSNSNANLKYSEVAMVYNIQSKLVEDLKVMDLYYSLNKFQEYSVELEIAFHEINRFCQRNTMFLKNIQEHMVNQINNIKNFSDSNFVVFKK